MHLPCCCVYLTVVDRPPAALQSYGLLRQASTAHSAVLDAEQVKQAAEEARRSKLYSIMACIREVQKRNDQTGGAP